MSFWLSRKVRKGFASTSVRRASHASSISPYRYFRRESGRDAARYNETASSGFVRVSTLAFRTFQAYFARPRPKEEICLCQKSFFFLPSPPCPPRVRPPARPPSNIWHVRGLVISSELDSSSIQLRVHDPVEKTLYAALCGISGPYSRVIDFCFCSPASAVAKLSLRYGLLLDSDIFRTGTSPTRRFPLVADYVTSKEISKLRKTSLH